MLKSLLLTSVLVLPIAATAEVLTTPSETVTLAPGSAVQWRTTKSFTRIEAGDDTTVSAAPGATDRDLIIVAKPLRDGVRISSANVLALDQDGQVVGMLLVYVSRSNRSLIKIIRGTEVSFYDCDIDCSLKVDLSNTPLPDVVTTTNAMPNGGIITRQYGPK